MDRLKRPPTFKVPEATTEAVQKASTLSGWIPLICAGAAAGVSIVALTEIKKLRKEITDIKTVSTNESSELLGKRMENMESQLKTLTEFIKNKNEIESASETIKRSVPPTGVVKNVVDQNDGIQIINGEEYEEVEVTDDESED